MRVPIVMHPSSTHTWRVYALAALPVAVGALWVAMLALHVDPDQRRTIGVAAAALAAVLACVLLAIGVY